MSSGSKRNSKGNAPPSQKRLRTDASSPNCGILDALPYEISKRIVQHVCSGNGTLSAIELGLTSKQQSLIVSDVISGKLFVNSYSTLSDVSRWIASMNRILELVVIGVEGKRSSEIVRKVLLHTDVPLRKLSLRRLSSDQLSNVLQLVPKLREVEVAIGNEGDRVNFVKAVSNKHLRKLKIRPGSRTRQARTCIIDMMGFPSVKCFADEIGAACCNLEELSLSCDCSTYSCPITTFDATKVPHLRSLSLHTRSNFPDSAVTSLRSIESLSISGTNAVQFAGLIGSTASAIANIVGIVQRFESNRSRSPLLTPDTFSLQRLLRCPRLRKLDLPIKLHFASKLATIVTELRSLRELTVTTWGTYFVWPHMVIEFAPGAVLSIAKALPALEKLHLLDTRISQDEIVDVLEELGKRLISFEGSARWQAEERLERVGSLLCAAIRFNPRLEHFDVHALSSKAESRFHSSDVLRVKLLMKKLQTVAPLVDMAALSDRLNTLLWRA